MQRMEPGEESLFGGQGRQLSDEDWPKRELNVPVGHFRHRSGPWAPGKALKVPGGHLLQVEPS